MEWILKVCEFILNLLGDATAAMKNSDRKRDCLFLYFWEINNFNCGTKNILTKYQITLEEFCKKLG